MPQVRVPEQTIGTAALPGPRGPAAPTADDFGAGIGQNLVQLGTGIARAETAEQVAQQKKLEAEQERARELADQVRVDDALNSVKERSLDLTFGKTGYSKLAGRDALERPSKMPLANEYAAELDKHIQEVGQTLSTDRQRAAFGIRVNDVRTSFYGHAQQHEARQSQLYQKSVDDGTISNAHNAIGLFYNDPDQVDTAVKSIEAAVARTGRMLGRSASEIESDTRKATSSAHMLAITAALQKNDPRYAEMYLKHYAKQMDAGDILKVQGQITKEVDVRIGAQVADKVFTQAAPAIHGNDFERAVGITKGTESQNRQFDAKGNPLKSSAGAIGIMQVMEGTGPEAAALAGLPWDRDKWLKDATYNEAIGRAYLAKQLRDFGGDLGKAWAAYNAGPAATKTAIAMAEKDGKREDGSYKGAGWLGVLKRPDGGVSTELSIRMDDVIGGKPFPLIVPSLSKTEVDTLLSLKEGERPPKAILDKAVAFAESRVKQGLSPFKGSGYLSYLPEETQKYVAKNLSEFQGGGGRPAQPTLESLQDRLRADQVLASRPGALKAALADVEKRFEVANKAVKQNEETGVANAQRWLVANNGDFANMPATLRGAIPPGKYDDVLGFAGKLSKGTPVETDWNIYERLRTEARERPQEFARIDLASTFNKLAPAQREALIDLQDKAKKDPKGMAEVATLDAQLGDAHDKLGLTGTGNAEKRGLFDETVRREISAAQATKGKPLTYEERQAVINRNAVKRDQWFGTTRLFEAKAEGKAGDFKPEVPRGDRAQITEALQRRGIPVTEANILELYRRRLGLAGATAPRSGAGVTGEF